VTQSVSQDPSSRHTVWPVWQATGIFCNKIIYLSSDETPSIQYKLKDLNKLLSLFKTPFLLLCYVSSSHYTFL
jgi:hypothetical protein